MTNMTRLKFEAGEYDNMPGYWAIVKANDIVVSGGHFNTKADVYKFYCQSRRYFKERLEGKIYYAS